MRSVSEDVVEALQFHASRECYWGGRGGETPDGCPPWRPAGPPDAEQMCLQCFARWQLAEMGANGEGAR